MNQTDAIIERIIGINKDVQHLELAVDLEVGAAGAGVTTFTSATVLLGSVSSTFGRSMMIMVVTDFERARYFERI